MFVVVVVVVVVLLFFCFRLGNSVVLSRLTKLGRTRRGIVKLFGSVLVCDRGI